MYAGCEDKRGRGMFGLERERAQTYGGGRWKGKRQEWKMAVKVGRQAG
ncbi:MAG: hypothetical protein ACYTEL_17310 [Planctomycetota bacterium]